MFTFAVWWPRCFQSGDICYDSSVFSILLLRESVLGHATFELDAHVETVQSATGFGRQHKKDLCVVIFDQLLLFATASDFAGEGF